MPYIAIFHVPDDHTARAIMEGDIPVSRRDMRIVALHEFPSKSDPACTGCSASKGNGWGRSPRGWMRCSTCGHRSRNVRRWFVGSLFDWFGANLIGDRAPKMFRTPEGYGPCQCDPGQKMYCHSDQCRGGSNLSRDDN